MIYLVNQGKTYKYERKGGYLWSPKLDKRGNKNAGYSLMTKVRAGDFILHNSGGKISAISIVTKGCYDALQPRELHNSQNDYEWNDDGYRIDVEYYDFDNSLINSDLAIWAIDHLATESCFDRKGKLKLRYLCNVADAHSEYILNEALSIQKNTEVRGVIYQALSEILFEENDDYDEGDNDIIENIISLQTGLNKNYSGTSKKPQELKIFNGSNKLKPKRDPKIAANALENANYKCEFDESHKTFYRNNGRPYTEPHHLIPISRYADFKYSVDVEENIVSLCSHCHNLLHYGRMKDKEQVLYKLYNSRISMLKEAGLDLTFERLKSYYE